MYADGLADLAAAFGQNVSGGGRLLARDRGDLHCDLLAISPL